MQAIREIRRISSGTITLNIPEEFRERDVEIILLPITDEAPENRAGEKLEQFDQVVKNAKERNITIDKNIDIDELMAEMNNGLC